MLQHRDVGWHGFATRGDDVLLEPARTGARRASIGDEGGDRDDDEADGVRGHRGVEQPLCRSHEAHDRGVGGKRVIIYYYSRLNACVDLWTHLFRC